ncbi:MAG: VacJ family lipoprotein [Gallionella sp.]|nr:VacJ family lipoprotein [Gallionella sp.]MDP1941082.1 VacJ family lipoprotein [Gallionella sp.]
MKTIRIFLALAALALTGCASTQVTNPADPLEPLNRGVYQFNDTLDKAITKPVAQGYNTVMPEMGKIMVANFFSNLDDVVVTANDLLQFKLAQAASDGSRFLFNSTFGVFGLFNVTSRLEKHNEDFGQTLGYWGVASGPYLIVPILGPSTVRDSIGDIGDSQVSLLSRAPHVRTRNQLYLLKAVKRRAQLLTQESVLEGAMIDRYAFIRDAYLQRRQNLVYDGNPPQDDYDDMESDFEYQPDAPATPATDNAEPAVAPTGTDSAPSLPATQEHNAHKH